MNEIMYEHIKFLFNNRLERTKNYFDYLLSAITFIQCEYYN